MGIVRKTRKEIISIALFNDTNSIHSRKMSTRLGKLQELFDSKISDRMPMNFEHLIQDNNVKILKITSDELQIEVLYTETDASYNARLAEYNNQQSQIEDRLEAKKEAQFNKTLQRIRDFLEEYGYSVTRDEE